MIELDRLRHLLLTEPPSETLFKRITAAIQPKQGLSDVHIAYLRDHLATWPQHIPRYLCDPWNTDAQHNTPQLPHTPIFNAARFFFDMNWDGEPILDKILHTLSSPHIETVAHLHLWGVIKGRAFARLLKHTNFPTTLHTFIIAEPIRQVGAKALSLCKALTHLKNLNLSKLECGPKGIRHILQSPYLTSLQTLALSTDLTQDLFQDLCHSPLTAHLSALDLTVWDLDIDKGLRDAPCSQTLQKVCFWGRISQETQHTLLTPNHFPQLQHLDVSCCNIHHLHDTFTNSTRTSLRHLNLSHNALKNQSAVQLAHSPLIRHLETLDLSNNTIGDQGAIALATSEHLSTLQSFSIHHNRFSERGLHALQNSPYLANVPNVTLHTH